MPQPVLQVHIMPPTPEAYRQDGLTPKTAVCSLGPTHFRVAFAKRLHLRIENGSRTSRNVTLTLTGSAPGMMDHPYLRDARSGEWHPVAGLADGDSVHVDLRIPPGHADFAITPPYSTDDCDRFLKRIADDSRVTVTSVGKSGEGRDLWVVKFSEPGDSPESRPLKRICLLAARAHAWETAGNYSFEGIADFLLSDSRRVALYLRWFDIYLCPMLNPDGVANGTQRHAEGAADLNRDIPTNEASSPGSGKAPELVCHLGLINRLKPVIYCQFHNMSKKYIDCVLGMDSGHAERFLWLAPSFKEHLKRWGVDKSRPGTLPAYCRHRDPACVACTFEFPWFARTTADMRAIGPGVLEALLNTRIQVQEQVRKPG